MKIKFPQLIYFIDYTNKHLLLRFRLLPLNQSLFLEIELSQLTIQESNINLKQSFYNNPTDEGLYDRTNKILIDSNHLGYNEIIGFKRYLDGLAANSKDVNIVLKNKVFTLQLEDWQLYGVSLCVNDIANNYNSYQISLIEIITKYKDELVSIEEVVKVEPAIVQVIDSPPLENSENVNPPLENNIIQDLLQLSPNNLTTFYLSKYIYTNIIYKNNTFHIPNNFLSYTYQNKLNLYNIIKSLNSYNDNELLERRKILYNNLYNIAVKDIVKDNVQNIYIILFLIYIYSIKLVPAAEAKVYNFDIDLKETFIKFLNPILKKITPENNFIIKVEYDQVMEANNLSYDEALDPLVQKYKYLINVDKDLFIKSVLTDLKDDAKPKSKSKFKLPMLVAPYLRELGALSEEYLMYQDLDAGKLIQNPPLLIKNNFDIIKSIIKSIDNNYSPINPTSNLVILYDFIIPYTDNSSISLEILHKIIMPYLKDKYGVDQFFEYFI